MDLGFQPKGMFVYCHRHTGHLKCALLHFHSVTRGQQSNMESARNEKVIFVFDYPRTCSNLLGNLFSVHPEIEYIHRPYLLSSTRGPEKTKAQILEATQQRLAAKFTNVTQADVKRWAKITFDTTNKDLGARVKNSQDLVCLLKFGGL